MNAGTRRRISTSASKNPDKGPWATWYDQQAIKSVIKRAYKQLPKVDALERIIRSDNEAMGFTTASEVADIIKPAENAAPALPDDPSPKFDFPLTGQGDPADLSDLQQEAEALRASASGNALESTLAKIAACKTADELDLVADEIRFIEHADYQNQLYEAVKQRRTKLGKK